MGMRGDANTLPSGWKKLRLDQISRIVGGSTPSTERTEFWDGTIAWTTPKDLSNLEGSYLDASSRTITEAGLQSCAAEVLPPNSVLFSSRAPIGLVAINRIPVATNQGFKSFVVQHEIADAKYLYHWLKTNRSYLESLGNGATFKEVSKAIVSRVEIPVPPLAEQKRIAAILDQADSIRRKRQQALRLTDEFLRSVFLDMFGDPVTNPKGWPRMSLETACSWVVDCPHTTPRWTEAGEICLRTSNLGDGIFIWDDKRYISEDQHVERSRRLELECGDIVLSREGTVGIAAIVPAGTRMSMGQRLVQLRPDDQFMLSQFLLRLILWVLDPTRIRQVMVGSTSKHLNVGELRKLNIICPPLALQKTFDHVGCYTLQTRERQLLATAEADTLFQSLQRRAFTGQL